MVKEQEYYGKHRGTFCNLNRGSILTRAGGIKTNTSWYDCEHCVLIFCVLMVTCSRKIDRETRCSPRSLNSSPAYVPLACTCLGSTVRRCCHFSMQRRTSLISDGETSLMRVLHDSFCAGCPRHCPKEGMWYETTQCESFLAFLFYAKMVSMKGFVKKWLRPKWRISADHFDQRIVGLAWNCTSIRTHT